MIPRTFFQIENWAIIFFALCVAMFVFQLINVKKVKK